MLIPTNGIRLHAKTSGPETGPLLILLHGFPEFWYGWHEIIEPLSQAGYHVVVPDQRGYNLSDKPGAVSEYQIDRLAEDVTGIIDYFGREKAVVAGHDWGAAIAWHLGMHHPKRIERLIIINVPHFAAYNLAVQKLHLRQLLKSWYILFFQLPRIPEWALARKNFAPLKSALLRTSRPGTFTREDLGQYTAAWSQPGALSGGINWYRAMTRVVLTRGKRVNDQVFQHRVPVPTLVLWGDRDAFLEPVLASLSMEWVDQGKLIRFADASHWVLREEKEKVLSAILDFLGVRE